MVYFRELQLCTKLAETNEYQILLPNVLTNKGVKNMESFSPPVQYFFIGFAIHQALFAQRNNIENTDIGPGGGGI